MALPRAASLPVGGRVPVVFFVPVTSEELERVAVVIPTKNEAENLPFVIERVKPHCSELIVVDGDSGDGTREIAARHGARVLRDGGQGKGAGLRQAAREATREILVFIDADGSHDPDDIPRVAGPVLAGEYDLVIGSRMRGGSDELHSSLSELVRLVGNEVTTLIVNYRFRQRLTDCHNGLRAIRREVMNGLRTTENGFIIEQEICLKCLVGGYRVGEVPAHEYRRRSGESRLVVWRVAWRSLWCLLKHLG